MKKLFSLCFALASLVLATACGNTNNEPTPPVSDDLIITSAKRYILADGKDAAAFTVMHKGADVTAKSIIYDVTSGSSKPLSSTSFTTSQAGAYTLYAVCDGVISERIVVQGATFFPEMPTDLLPEKFDFVKRVAVSQFTSTGCIWCPLIMKTMHDYKAKAADAAKVIYIGSHYGFRDPFETRKSAEMGDEYGSMSLPYITFGMSKDLSNQSGSNLSVEKMQSIVNRMMDILPNTGVSASIAVKNGKVCVRADVKVRVQGAIKIGAILVEDSLVYTQSNATDLREDYFNTHNYVVRAAYPAVAKQLNENLGGLSPVPAKSKQSFYCEFDIAKAKVAKTENARVIIFTYDATKVECDNIVSVNLDSKLEFEYL